MKKWLLALCCVLVLGGCAPRTKVIEDIQLIQAIGYDYVNKNEFRSVASSLIVLPSEETLPQTKVFTATGNTSRITKKKMQTESSKYMVVGRIGLMLFQDRLAEDGIFYFLNVHQRDSMIGRNLRPAIVEGKTFDLLSKNYHLDTTVYQYLNELLEQSEREIYPRVTLHTALYQYYAEGTDMFLPIIKGNDDHARVTGLALFKEDRYIDKLNVHEASFFKLLSEPFRGGFYQVQISSDSFASLENVQATPQYTITKDDNGLHVSILVYMKGVVSESGGLSMSAKDLTKIKELGIQQFEEQMQTLVNRFQQRGIDPIGLGDVASSKIRHLNMEQWHDTYPSLDIDVNVDLTVIGSGITD